MAKLIHSMIPNSFEHFEGTAQQALKAVLDKFAVENRAHHQKIISDIDSGVFADKYSAEFLADRRAESVRSVESPAGEWTTTEVEGGLMLHPRDIPLPQETFFLLD